ncbi:cytochrome P450 307a1-like [Phymastichus coffea]|uniref:cytochrome P450 307a1-like n=1 Tax=Phymastichus coffea TaxID=108790 RepID=UPI00273CAF42|nr:cytochrome P450 307a1-like [Phymastichus coffea]XP_058801129.1 cytochrome P450 307a1-like [Phymastichus coffea]
MAAFWLLFCCVAVLSVALAFTSKLTSRVEAFVVRKLRRGKSAAVSAEAKKSLRGPKPFPVIGSLHKLDNPGGPFKAFTTMAKQYGDIYEIQLGVCKCVVVSSYSLAKEVLIAKGSHFGGRPDFLRFHQLFGGDRNNSLALCDWSDLQRKRRSIARSFCSPRGGSSQLSELSRVAVDEMRRFHELLNADAAIREGQSPVKPLILTAIGNMFTQYMCSTRFGYEDDQFNKVVRTFDEIFWDINQGYAVDFLPWLKILYTGHLNRMNEWADYIRSFILKEIIEPRRATLDLETGVPRDFTDALLFYLESDQPELSWQHILFELEDFLGGHSAIGNLVMMVLSNVVSHPGVQRRIQQECDDVLRDKLLPRGVEHITLDERQDLPYTEATIWETLRVSSSPIVPHVSTCDTDIAGYSVAKDTVVFVNNYDLNLGESYWGADAKQFRPERFVKQVAGVSRVVRPEHFVPFSTGKRTCIGQRLVQGFAFVMVTSLLSKFDVSTPPGVDVAQFIKPSCVAVPPDCFHLTFTPRDTSRK